MNKLDMEGRSVIVTGGASGIGLAIVKRLIRSGANVAVWDLNELGMEDIVKTLPKEQIHAEKVDITKFGEVGSAFKSTTNVFPKIDGPPSNCLKEKK